VIAIRHRSVFFTAMSRPLYWARCGRRADRENFSCASAV